jgi:hypothetical protein
MSTNQRKSQECYPVTHNGDIYCGVHNELAFLDSQAQPIRDTFLPNNRQYWRCRETGRPIQLAS